MNPPQTADRVSDLKEQDGIGYCNITKCCTKFYPEHVTMTDAELAGGRHIGTDV